METGHLFPKLGQKPWSPPNMLPPCTSPPPQSLPHHDVWTHVHTYTGTHTGTGRADLPPFLFFQCPAPWLVRFLRPGPCPHPGKAASVQPQLTPLPCRPPWRTPSLRGLRHSEDRHRLNSMWSGFWAEGCVTSDKLHDLLNLKFLISKSGRILVPSSWNCCKN